MLLKSKLNGYFEWITKKAVSLTIEVFDKKAKYDLVHTLQEFSYQTILTQLLNVLTLKNLLLNTILNS